MMIDNPVSDREEEKNYNVSMKIICNVSLVAIFF
jgi:hypothetical protein